MTAVDTKLHTVAKVAARKNGASVTFTLTNPGTYNRTTDTWSGETTVTVVGVAERVQGDPVKYQALGLSESEAPTLEFTPDTIGERPPLNSTVTFGGIGYTVRDEEPYAPGGVTVSSRVVVVR